MDDIIVDFIHKFLTDKEIFDIEFVWLVTAIFTAVAPHGITEKIPRFVMKALNILTLHWNGSKETDIYGRRKY